MDALRLVLIIVGVVILVGIYLYSTRKRGTYEYDIDDTEVKERLDYFQSRRPSTDTERLNNLDPDDLSGQPAPASNNESSGERLPETALARSHAASAPSIPEAQPESINAVQGFPELIVLNIMARPGGAFHGPDVLNAVQTAGLEFGARGIFHRFTSGDGKRRPVFSLANMLEPGSFDFEDMAAFSTVGLTLFMQLPALADSLGTYEDMLSMAHAMASTLNGDVCDERRNILTLQAIEHTKEQLREYTYKLMVARKRAELER